MGIGDRVEEDAGERGVPGAGLDIGHECGNGVERGHPGEAHDTDPGRIRQDDEPAAGVGEGLPLYHV